MHVIKNSFDEMQLFSASAAWKGIVKQPRPTLYTGRTRWILPYKSLYLLSAIAAFARSQRQAMRGLGHYLNLIRIVTANTK